MLKAGDIVKAVLAGIPLSHVCIILEDEPKTGHVKCLPICNFTGSEVPPREYSIDISEFDLPNHWFEDKKPQTWLRCNEIDCVHSINVDRKNKLGNIIESFPLLWSKVCAAVHDCPIAEKLSKACDCDYKIFEKQIKLGKKEKSNCGCKN
ncbi:hypothetical protein [Flavobacterium soyae]|uniref:Uncharacterized protein n=1 Tax=Flavobacterium soyae TaxID=2903098 RepID=A0ABZ2UAL0_9FLAO